MGQYNPNEFQPGYGGMIDSEGNVKNIADVINEDGRVKIEAELTVSDVQIGAVEVKDATGANRLAINNDGSINVKGITQVIFSQPTAQSTWSITHNLGKNPTVITTDLDGVVTSGLVTYTSANALTISFTPASAGFAYLT